MATPSTNTSDRSAERTAELLDIRGKTNFVVVRDGSGAAGEDAHPVRRQAEAEAFVDAVLDAPPARVSADYSHVRPLVFKLEEGTEVARFYGPGSGELYSSGATPFLGVVLPEKLRGELRRAL